ncbi:hypothetical protein K6L44_11785 [Gluconacetobacter entanii]|nr:hypothetical protein [Gluconacetobacter entanii]
MTLEAPIVLAPFANERIREWPIENFQAFIECGLQDGRNFVISGTRPQRVRANVICRSFPAHRVQNICGTTTWSEMQSFLHDAPFVVANNSGMAHLAASRDLWVLCVFGGAHSYREWFPRGRRVVTLARRPICAPCANNICHNNYDCMANLSAEFAYNEIICAISDSKKSGS